jgi:hypothetical protein
VGVGEAADGDRADDGRKRALVAGLDRAVGATSVVGDPFGVLLPEGTEVEVVLQQQA